MYQNVEDQEDCYREANVLCSVDFMILPTGLPRADDHGLEDTQEASGTNAHAPTK